MSFLPIVERELRTAARKRGTYRTRTGFVLVTSLMAGVLLLFGNGSGAKQMGNIVFPILTWLAFAYCLLAGARQGADCLSEEKREGTLGLIFLTDLRGHDVVLGKLVSVSARAFQGLFAFLPVLAIGLVLGGITVGEFWRTAATLINALFFSLALALTISSVTRQSHVAVIGTLGALTLFTVTPLTADWVLSRLGAARQVLAWASPAAAALLAQDLSYRLHPGGFWTALALNHLLGWGLIAVASVALPRCWQERPGRTATALRTDDKSALRPVARAGKRLGARRQLLEHNPMCWLASRNEGERVWLWTFVALVAISGTAVLLLAGSVAGPLIGAAGLFTFGFGLVLKLWVSWHACSTLAEARRTGAIELLLATPLTVEEMIRGHWQALQRFFFWPTVTVLALMALPTVMALLGGVSPQNTPALLGPFPGVVLFGMATLVLDLFAVAWVGMWMGLSQPKAMPAFGKTVLFVLLVPALVFCFPSILFDLFWISWARRKLAHQFRLAATDRYAAIAQPDAGLSSPVNRSTPPVIRTP